MNAVTIKKKKEEKENRDLETTHCCEGIEIIMFKFKTRPHYYSYAIN